MTYLSYKEIRQFKENKKGYTTLAKSASAATAFLSHSWKDKEQIDGIVEFLSKFGASSYVDLKDDQLPHTPSPETAALLKSRIEECPRLVVLLSENSADSRWVPWELGYADGKKGLAKVAVLPITLTGAVEPWADQEYLHVYPRIKSITPKGSNEPIWIVSDPRDGKYWTLDKWFSSNVS